MPSHDTVTVIIYVWKILRTCLAIFFHVAIILVIYKFVVFWVSMLFQEESFLLFYLMP